MNTWREAEEAFDDLLDCDGPVKVAGLEYSASRILKDVDPIAYRTMMLDWLDAEGIDSDDLTC